VSSTHMFVEARPDPHVYCQYAVGAEGGWMGQVIVIGEAPETI